MATPQSDLGLEMRRQRARRMRMLVFVTPLVWFPLALVEFVIEFAVLRPWIVG